VRTDFDKRVYIEGHWQEKLFVVLKNRKMILQ